MSGRRILVVSLLLVGSSAAAALAYLLVGELRSSRYQARYFTRLARELTYEVSAGPSAATCYPTTGPYDLRLGYAGLPIFIDRLTANGFAIEAQTRLSPKFLEACDRGLYPVYREKGQAGLTIIGRTGRELHRFDSPRSIFASFDSIPQIVIESLLFIENGELLDPRFPLRNPAVEWDRAARAVFDVALKRIDGSRAVTGGSTLATQIEKLRHSPEGRTAAPREKIRQMATASLRAYLDGEDTTDSRQRIVTDYVNSLPLAARAEEGEVLGLVDGMQAWFGVGFGELSTALEGPRTSLQESALSEFAATYKQVLSLLIAARRPSHFLLSEREALESLTNSYLRVLAAAEIISPRVRDLALAYELEFREEGPHSAKKAREGDKAVDAIRIQALNLLGVDRLYDLDRLDLTLRTTLDEKAQREVAGFLSALSRPDFVRGAGLCEASLLERGDPAAVKYSVSLYERGERENLLRVQSDNVNQPFNVNESAKLELGSTAKLRTLVTYLEIVSDLNARYGTAPEESLRAARSEAADPLSLWALEYLIGGESRDLPSMLEAALLRTYSASPKERFFTGGGVHTFNNFDASDDPGVVSVRSGFRQSVNLVFIRLMRDIVRYQSLQVPGSSARIIDDRDDPHREPYLGRFADREGRQFIDRFLRKYRGRTPSEMMNLLLDGVEPTPRRLAVAYRAIAPAADLETFVALLSSRLPASDLDEAQCSRLYDASAPETQSLGDKGYITGVHPLELWVVSYLLAQPDANRETLMLASEQERLDVYRWLFKPSRKRAQDTRLQTILEVEAFLEIHRSWQRLGYPFDSLVPSYATALGSSGDRPAALAELLGIIINGGLRVPTRSIEEIHFGESTPYETILVPGFDVAERVLPSEVAAVVRDELFGVVTEGTGRRARSAFEHWGGDMRVGGKTGTGNNQFHVYALGGRLVESRPVNRVATFAFIIDERFFGTITAYVDGEGSSEYRFTSALPTQLLSLLAPAFAPLIVESESRSAAFANRGGNLAHTDSSMIGRASPSGLALCDAHPAEDR